jgi:hypothetical protein
MSVLSCPCMSTKSTVNPTADPLLTRKNLAGRWVCSIETLKRRERAGELPFLKIGKGVRYRPEVIARLEAEMEVQ